MIVRDKTLRKLAELSRTDLLWLARKARRELNRRFTSERAHREDLDGALHGMANVMAGVTWALACRQSLRRSKDHSPDTGKRPASGEMWLPYELLTALRHEIKERRWSPLGARCWADVQSWLTVEAGRKPEPVGPMAVAFRVRMARDTADRQVLLASAEQRH